MATTAVERELLTAEQFQTKLQALKVLGIKLNRPARGGPTRGRRGLGFSFENDEQRQARHRSERRQLTRRHQLENDLAAAQKLCRELSGVTVLLTANAIVMRWRWAKEYGSDRLLHEKHTVAIARFECVIAFRVVEQRGGLVVYPYEVHVTGVYEKEDISVNPFATTTSIEFLHG